MKGYGILKHIPQHTGSGAVTKRTSRSITFSNTYIHIADHVLICMQKISRGVVPPDVLIDF